MYCVCAGGIFVQTDDGDSVADCVNLSYAICTKVIFKLQCVRVSCVTLSYYPTHEIRTNQNSHDLCSVLFICYWRSANRVLPFRFTQMRSLSFRQ